ncbi:type 1 fimbrial protein [Erwinia sp. PK3-005]|uniref:Type 1 fimbrial protein n=1 Tax=Mixta hanseatica TaxID=2872648 RepID=A0ABY4R7A9_9GAMM|nr:fimbrial protein [Mixta hanseatica]UQY44130.1 type 1 fimbrial protein [Mixta hanseatica]
MELIKKDLCSTGAFLLLGMLCLVCNKSYATIIVCDSDSHITNSITAFDFNKLPNQIPDMLPVGTTIYDVTMNLDLWCAKEFNTETIMSPGPKKIYINRHNTDNALGDKSGLAFYVTINGDRDKISKVYDSGYTTDKMFINGMPTSNYTKLSIPVRIELVKTGANVALSPFRNDVILFSIGDAGTGNMRYRATNVRDLSFSSYTCNITTPTIHQTLPELNVADLPGSGRADNYVTDFSVLLRCNGKLWSTLSINMAFSGTPVAGLAQNGVYPFFDRFGKMAEGIGFQILHQDGNGSFIESGNNSKFKIGDFSKGNQYLNVPLRAAYYRTQEKVTLGELTGTVTYIVDYM